MAAAARQLSMAATHRPHRPAGGQAGIAAMIGLCAAAVACTDTQLRCVADNCTPEAALAVDNVVRAVGQVCTSQSAAASYPTKIVLVVDTSGSTRQSDPAGGRQRAVTEALNTFAANPDVYFALVAFSSDAVAAQRSFTRDHNLLLSAATRAALSGGATDYLATLQLVQDIIEADVAASPASQRLYTQYNVQWLSDGNPEIQPQVPAAGLPASDPALLRHCSQTRPLVEEAVGQLMALPAKRGFFSLTLSTIYLTGVFDSPCQVLIAQDPNTYGLGADYLQDMARRGNGSFQAVSASDLHFDITINTIAQRFSSRGFYLVNTSRKIAGPLLLPDSDQDGVADEVEQTLGLDPLRPRAQVGGCSDLVLQRSLADPSSCRQQCVSAAAAAEPSAAAGLGAPSPASTSTDADADADLLSNCEESVLASDPNLSDSDSDGIIDIDETRFGTDPRVATRTTLDSDLDGASDLQEVTVGTDPFAGGDAAYAYAYTRFDPLPVDPNLPGTTCYAFEIDNVQLAQTQATSSFAAGDNLVCLMMVEQPANDPTQQPTVSRACKVASYRVQPNGVALLAPADGVLRFVPADFVPFTCNGAACAFPAVVVPAKTLP